MTTSRGNQAVLLHSLIACAVLSVASITSGCSGGADEASADTTSEDSLELSSSAKRGKIFFNTKLFEGNGRTCSSCHDAATGTIAPASVQARFAANPGDSLFRSIDSDDGAGNSYTRLKNSATIRVHITLPANVSLADDPTARTVVLNRGVPSVVNSPALDKFLMVDGRETSVEAQAVSAINAHFQPGEQPNRNTISDIAAFERTLFSRPSLATFAQGGPPPSMPQGNTTLERAGRRFFVFDGPPTDAKSGMCAGCHGGPMLDTSFPIPGAPPSDPRFSNAFVSMFNKAQNPVHTYLFRDASGNVTPVVSPDPGRALITGNPMDADAFRITSLWGINKTAPYFHDNSAANLEELMAHYQAMFAIISGFTGRDMFITPDDSAAMVAYMKLL
jgi:cytochrome c peroxidase